MEKIKIEMILDLNCSWCPIGYKYITKALDNLNISIESVDFQFLPFRLNPEMPYDGEVINSHLKKATGQTDAQLKAYRENLVETANKCGLNINFTNRTHYFNTLHGHKIMQVAMRKSKQHEVYGILCDAYYAYGKKFSNDSVMENIADKLGFTKEILSKVLEDESLKENILNNEDYAKSLGVNSVPAFLIEGSYLIKGSNSVDYFEKIFLKLTETGLQHNL